MRFIYVQTCARGTGKERFFRMRRKLYIAIGLLAVLVFAVTSLQANLSKGDKAPDFRLASLDGKAVSLTDLRKDPKTGKNRAVVLDFWATWCPPCREETAHLQKLHEKYAEKGLVVVGISVDSDGKNAVKPFVQKNRLTYTQLLDQKHEAARSYRVGPIPTTYFIGRDGKIKSVQLGFAPGMEKGMEEDVKDLLK